MEKKWKLPETIQKTVLKMPSYTYIEKKLAISCQSLKTAIRVYLKTAEFGLDF